MRLLGAMLLSLMMLAAAVRAEDKKETDAPVRYGVVADLKSYPQGSPKETFGSVLKTIEAGRIDYLLAQLTDPAFVDERVKRLFGGKFDQQVAETKAKLDPPTVKQLHRFHDKGAWSEENAKAAVSLNDVPERVVNLKKIGPRWYLENHNRPVK